MKVLDRFLLFIYSLAIGVGSVVLIWFSIWIRSNGTDSYNFYLANTDLMMNTVIAVSILFFLISLRFFYLSVRRGRSSAPSIDQRTDFGDIRISLDTIENLTLKTASRIKGVKDIKTRVNVKDAGLEIMIRAVVDGENSIPQLTEEVQRSVKAHVEDITGIPVAAVSVYVANVIQSNSFKSRVE